MPLYTFVSKNKLQDFFFNSKDVPSIGKEIVVEGKKWVRAAIVPNYAIDEIGKINIDDPKDFARRTANHKGTVGELFDLSKQLSEERENRDGVDKIGVEFQKQKDAKLNTKRERNRQKKLNKVKSNAKKN